MNKDARKIKPPMPGRKDPSSKFLTFSKDGPPDRFALLPDGRIMFIELMDPRKGLTPQQVRRKAYLESLGLEVAVFYSTP